MNDARNRKRKMKNRSKVKNITCRAKIRFNGIYCDGCGFESDDEHCLLFDKEIVLTFVNISRNKILDFHARCKQCLEKTK